MQPYQTTCDLGNKLVIRAVCDICEGEYLDVLNKKQMKEQFICELCEEELVNA